MSIEIRAVEPEEYQQAVEVMTTAFLERPDTARIAEAVRATWTPGRTWVAFDGARACGTFRTWATEITLPGGAPLPASAVTAVTVLPTHRRRGILSAMAAREHAAMRERGEGAGVLWASEFGIYGRFGYGPAARDATWTIKTRETGWHGAPSGSVELAPLVQATADAMCDVYEVCRPLQAGHLRRRPIDWELDLGLRPPTFGDAWKGFVALHRDETGTVDGYVRYTTKTEWSDHIPQGTVEVEDLHATTPEAYAALWQYLAGIDLVTAVKAESRKPSEPLPWLATNQRAVRQSQTIDAIWVRLLDLPRALEARTWERAGSLVLEVAEPADEGRPATTGRWLLDVSPDGARCTPTARPAELHLPVAALGAAVLGGTRLGQVVLTTGCDEVRPGALALAESLFRTADEPWCPTGF
jgi:predicted acetyltransferase